nr:reverse transcriptase domain-containing protein [Tanacetum cinerariifolium]
GTFMKRRPKECYDLIKNMTAHHNDWDTSAQRSESSSSINSSSDLEIAALKVEKAEINKNLRRVLQVNHHCQNPPPAYQAPTYQDPGYQAPVHQSPIPQPQVVSTNEFNNYMKENDAILKNMKTNMTSLNNSNLELKNMFGQFMKMNTASSSGLGTLPSYTITNPKEDLKGIATRSGNAYQGPTIPTTSSSLSQAIEREIEVTKDPVNPINNESTKDVQPSVVQVENPIQNSEPIVSSIIEPVVAPVRTFHFPADFVVVDFDVDPRVPLILGRSFLKTERSLIDVFEGELTLRVGKEAITFNLDQTSRYSANYNDRTANRIDVIDMASKTDKSSIDEPPKVELKDLPPHLEYAFLEGNDKLPFIITKDLSDEEKTALIKVLKSHKKDSHHTPLERVRCIA